MARVDLYNLNESRINSLLSTLRGSKSFLDKIEREKGTYYQSYDFMKDDSGACDAFYDAVDYFKSELNNSILELEQHQRTMRNNSRWKGEDL